MKRYFMVLAAGLPLAAVLFDSAFAGVFSTLSEGISGKRVPVVRVADTQTVIRNSGNSSAGISQQGGNSTATIIQNGKSVTMKNGKVVEGSIPRPEAVTPDCDNGGAWEDEDLPCRAVEPVPPTDDLVPEKKPRLGDASQSPVEERIEQDFGIRLNPSPVFRRLFLERMN